MSKTLKEIHAAMQALEERFDNGKISEKIFEMRYSRLQEQLKHVQNSLEPQEHKVGIRSCSKLTALEQGISCLQLDVMDVVGHYRIIKNWDVEEWELYIKQKIYSFKMNVLLP